MMCSKSCEDGSVPELLNTLASQQANDANQVGYTALFEKDFMVFPNRTHHDVNEQTFQISKWNAHQDKSIEQVTYYSPKDPKDPSKVITKMVFEGWRRYVEERRETEGGRIIFHIKSLEKQSKLARAIDDKSFREIGWMEPLVAETENPILAVNFRETAVEKNPDYIDDLFSRISHIEKLPSEIITDLKNVIALNSIDRFKKRMIECGFSEYEYEEALKLIRPTALKGVASPFYAGSLFCRSKGKLKEARKLLRLLKKHQAHWQYEEADELERSLYEQEVRENKQKYEQVIQQLKTEVTHLRARGSIANQTSSVEISLQATEAVATQQNLSTKIQQEAETLKKMNAQHAQQVHAATLTPVAKEIIPYFQGLKGALATRQETEKPKSPSKTHQHSFS